MSPVKYVRHSRRIAIGLVLGSLLCLANPLIAQEDTRSQLWMDYHSHYYQSEQREWYADGGVRVLPEDFSWSQVYVRPSVRFHRRRAFDGHAGLGVFYTLNEDAADILEVRPWQGVKYRWPILAHLTFSHYFRLEERFSFSDGSSELALRFRYKLSTRIALKRAAGHSLIDPLFMPLSVELFADAGPTVEPLFGSRGRFDVGLGYVFNEGWVGEFHVVAQASRSGLDETLDTSEIIFRFQLKHLLTAKDYRMNDMDLAE